MTGGGAREKTVLSAGGEKVLVALGSNIEPERYLPTTILRLRQRFPDLAVSPVYSSQPVGTSGPEFHNAAVCFRTRLSPEKLKFDVLRPLEADFGRVRCDDRNAPRTIDLDIAFFGDRVIDDRSKRLRIPDPEVLRYAHLAVPLADLEPCLRHPVDGRALAEIAEPFRRAGGLVLVSG
ncbi:MAG: 2-amino-4-hydroxy-6-hydroxymethyldihydropteridine diphosphokinase [Acidobacteriota bacterium]